MPKYNRKILVVLSDTHGGEKRALMSPEVELEDEEPDGTLVPYTPELTASQKYLWEKYTKDIDSVKRLAGKDEIVVIHNGDINHGNKYMDGLVSTRISDQIRIGVANMFPWLRLKSVKTMRLACGTGAHDFGEGSAEYIIASILKETFKKDVIGLYHGLATIAGLRTDYAHHRTSAGIRNWLRGNIFRLYIKSQMMDELDAGDTPPDIIAGAHFHTKVEETVTLFRNGKRYITRGIVTPSYSLINPHARQVTKSKYKIGIGLAAFEIINSKILDLHWFDRTVDIRTKEIL